MPSIDEVTVMRELDSILDPCSMAAGAPAGIVTMGLVRELRLDRGTSGTVIRLKIGVTEPGCLMGAAFAEGARERLASLPGVQEVEVELDELLDWEPTDMAEEYRERLELLRGARRTRIPSLFTSNKSAVPVACTEMT
jgi:metal-sulfur cluster biosynthetic enzyme